MEAKNYKNIGYVFNTPDNFDKNKKYPGLIVLHGAGSRGSDASALFNNPFFLNKEENYNGFVIAAPQCPNDMTWFDIFEQLKEFALAFYTSEFVDKKHFFCMGPSMGGYGTWQLAMSMPELFAAIVPICGGGMYWNADRLADVGVWAFHGALDNVVMPEESKKMVDAVNRCGGSAKLTIYPENDHNAWSDTYRNPEVEKWLLSHGKKAAAKALKSSYNNSELFG